MKSTQKNIQSSEIGILAKSIIKTLAYYDIFNYPLKREEIYICSNTNSNTKTSFFEELELLVSLGIVYSHGNFFSINHNSHLIPKRIEGNERAMKKMKTARFFSTIISRFPFVRGVFLSGSISKGYMNEKADIDYFIITAPNRLWIARILLVTFKRVFLFNSYKIFCINFFIDSENLGIEDRNIFTATECATLIPVYGSDVYLRFYEANKWMKSFFPNYPKRDTSQISKTKRKILQLIIEPMLNNKLGDYLDDYCMNLFIKHDKRMYGNLSREVYSVAFRTRKSISKHHPNYYQHKVLSSLKEKLEQLELKHNIALSEVER